MLTGTLTSVTFHFAALEYTWRFYAHGSRFGAVFCAGRVACWPRLRCTIGSSPSQGIKNAPYGREGALFNFVQRGCQTSIRQNPAVRFLAVAAVDWIATRFVMGRTRTKWGILPVWEQ
jgi:hypothetical protein